MIQLARPNLRHVVLLALLAQLLVELANLLLVRLEAFFHRMLGELLLRLEFELGFGFHGAWGC